MLFTAHICIISCLFLNLLSYSSSHLGPSRSPPYSLAWISPLLHASVTLIVFIKGLQGGDQSHLPSLQRGDKCCRMCLLLTSAKTFNITVEEKPQRQIQKISILIMVGNQGLEANQRFNFWCRLPFLKAFLLALHYEKTSAG